MNEDYSDILENVKNTYAPKIIAYLEKIRNVLLAESLITDPPADMSADDYEWGMIVYRHPQLHAPGTKTIDLVDISVTIEEERAHEGGEGYGINFSVDIVDWGGKMLGGMTPYNYTPSVWVDARDTDAVLARWEILENADIESIPDLITEGWDWNEDGYYKKEKS